MLLPSTTYDHYDGDNDDGGDHDLTMVGKEHYLLLSFIPLLQNNVPPLPKMFAS